MKRIPRPDLNDPELILGIRAKAFNLRSPGDYHRYARVFFMQRRGDTLSIEEWKKEGGGWHAEPVWKKEFRSDGLDELVADLMEKVSGTE